MIVSKDIHPQRDLYFLGAELIEALEKINGEGVEFLDLFQEVCRKDKISINLFILALDWLFLLGIIEVQKNGALKKCF